MDSLSGCPFSYWVANLITGRRVSQTQSQTELACATQNRVFWAPTPKNTPLRVHIRPKTDADPL